MSSAQDLLQPPGQESHRPSLSGKAGAGVCVCDALTFAQQQQQHSPPIPVPASPASPHMGAGPGDPDLLQPQLQPHPHQHRPLNLLEDYLMPLSLSPEKGRVGGGQQQQGKAQDGWVGEEGAATSSSTTACTDKWSVSGVRAGVAGADATPASAPSLQVSHRLLVCHLQHKQASNPARTANPGPVPQTPTSGC